MSEQRIAERAPDNMPTTTLRNMVAYAEGQCSQWERVENEHYERMQVANDMYTHWKQQVIDLQKQLDTRLAEESVPYVPYLDAN